MLVVKAENINWAWHDSNEIAEYLTDQVVLHGMVITQDNAPQICLDNILDDVMSSDEFIDLIKKWVLADIGALAAQPVALEMVRVAAHKAIADLRE